MVVRSDQRRQYHCLDGANERSAACAVTSLRLGTKIFALLMHVHEHFSLLLLGLLQQKAALQIDSPATVLSLSQTSLFDRGISTRPAQNQLNYP